MTNPIRRIVTGLDAAGRSCVASDERVGEAAPYTVDLWASGGGAAGADAPPPPFGFYAGPGETLLRVVTLPPAPPELSKAESEAAARAFFAAVGAADCQVDTGRHPWMHRTATIDYVIVLSGEVTLLLDVGEALTVRPHEIVVQRATNHAWINGGPEPAVFLVVMIGAG